MLRILLVSSAFFPKSTGGGEVQVLTHARALAARGWEPTILTFEDDPQGFAVNRDVFEGVPVVRLRAPASRSWYTRPRWLIDWATEWLAEEKIDLVHVFLWVHLLGVISAARAVGVPVVLTALEFGYFCRRFDLLRDGSVPCALDARRRVCEMCALSAVSARQKVLARAGRVLPAQGEMALRRGVHWLLGRDLFVSLGGRSVTEEIERQRRTVDDELSAVIVPSSVMREFYVAQGVPKEKLHFIPYAIEPPRVRPNWKPQARILKVSFIGRLHPAKGMHVILDALALLNGGDARISVNVWAPEDSGPPDYVASLRSRAGKDPRVQWHGKLPRQRLSEAFSETDALLVPSVWYENSPVVIGEALAHGCPVVCSDTKGMTDLVQDGVNGFTFPMGDARALARLLSRLAADPETLEKLRRGIRPLRTSAEVADDVVRLYGQVLNGKVFPSGQLPRLSARS